MDQFKFNAAKMIAAQKTKNRPVSPESESNWDSSEAENTAPHISSDDDEEASIISNKSKGHSKANTKTNNKPLNKAASGTTNRHLKPSNLVNGDRTPIKNSPASSIKSGTSKKGGAVTVFVDNRGFDSEEDDDPVSVTSKSSKKSLRKVEKPPPYDFRNALQDATESDRDRNSQLRPGKNRKGNTYDPTPKRPDSSEEKGTGSWDDSDEEKETLTAIRREMEKHNKQGADSKQNLTSSPEAKGDTKGTSAGQNWVVKPRGRLRNPKPPNSPSPRSVRGPTQLGTTTSDIELSKMATGLDVSGNYGNTAGFSVTGDYGTDTQQSSAHGGNIGTGLPTLPAVSNAKEHRYVFCYDHGSTAYYDTRHGRQEIYMTKIADKSERLVRRCTLELFAALRIIADFFIILILEFLRFIAYHIIGVFLVGLLTTFGDYLFKPVLAAFFNAILQPIVVFLYNIGVACRTMLMPVSDIMRGTLTQLAILVRAFRLVELNWRTSPEYSNQRSIQEV